MFEKAYITKSYLIKHFKTRVHLKRLDNQNKNPTPKHSHFVDCDETIKVEEIKAEIKEEESDDDSISIPQ